MLVGFSARRLPTRLVEPVQPQATGTFRSLTDAVTWFDAERPNLVAVVHLAVQAGHDADVLHMANLLGYLLQERGGRHDAVAVHRLAVDAARRAADPVAEGRSLLALGNAHRALHDVEQGDGFLRQGLEVLQQSGDQRSVHGAPLELETSRLAALVHDTADGNTGQFDERATESRRATGLLAKVYAVEAARDDATKLFVQHRFDEAIVVYERVRSEWRTMGYRSGEGEALNNIGDCHYHKRELGAAVAYYTESIAVSHSAGHRQSETQTRVSLGNACQDSGKLDLAVTHYEHAAAVFRAMHDKHGEAMTLYNLSYALARREERDQARTCLLRALELLEQLQGHRDAARVRRRLDTLGL